MSPEDFTNIFGQLTPKPRSVLILLLEGKEDEEIAQEIGATEATVRKHVQNLCDRFEIPSEIAGIKKNRRQELITLASRYLPDLVADRIALHQIQSSQPTPVTLPAKVSEPQDWGGAPDVSVFYGRSEELAKLKQWILEENCRLIALLGMAGIGKTTLSVKLSREIEDNFDYVVWRSLRSTPRLNQLLTDLIEFLSPWAKATLSNNSDRSISQLLEVFRNSRCLVILDSFDAILSHGDFAGHYQESYKDYSHLLKRIAQEPHKSCVIVTSLEKPREIALLEGETLPVRSWQLEGLGNAAREILKAKGLTAEQRWRTLIKLYRGNPLALKMVASTIQELFGGNVADFLDMSLTGIVQDIIYLVEQQFERLSPLEKDIMYWLAIAQDAVSLTELRNLLPVLEIDLFTALKSLGERSLIEKSSGKFSLQPVVKEYVKTQFVRQICQEIHDFKRTQDFSLLKLLKSHPLEPPMDNERSVENKEQSILSLFKNRLLATREATTQNLLVEQIEAILNKVEQNVLLGNGYIKINLRHLLSELKGN